MLSDGDCALLELADGELGYGAELDGFIRGCLPATKIMDDSDRTAATGDESAENLERLAAVLFGVSSHTPWGIIAQNGHSAEVRAVLIDSAITRQKFRVFRD